MRGSWDMIYEPLKCIFSSVLKSSRIVPKRSSALLYTWYKVSINIAIKSNTNLGISTLFVYVVTVVICIITNHVRQRDTAAFPRPFWRTICCILHVWSLSIGCWRVVCLGSARAAFLCLFFLFFVFALSSFSVPVQFSTMITYFPSKISRKVIFAPAFRTETRRWIFSWDVHSRDIWKSGACDALLRGGINDIIFSHRSHAYLPNMESQWGGEQGQFTDAADVHIGDVDDAPGVGNIQIALWGSSLISHAEALMMATHNQLALIIGSSLR